MREPQRGTVSSNSKFQTVLIQRYSANLSWIAVRSNSDLSVALDVKRVAHWSQSPTNLQIALRGRATPERVDATLSWTNRCIRKSECRVSPNCCAWKWRGLDIETRQQLHSTPIPYGHKAHMVCDSKFVSRTGADWGCPPVLCSSRAKVQSHLAALKRKNSESET